MSLALSLKIRRVAHVVGLLFPVVVVAQRQPTFLNNRKKPTPQLPASGVSHFVITGEEIRRRNLRSLDDLLRGEVPDMFATGPATDVTTNVRSRGLASSTEWATPRVYLNGVALNDASVLREIAPEIVDSVVVRPGVLAGTFEGTGSTGGVIYIYTQRGSDSTRVVSSGKIAGGKDRSLYDGKSHRFHDDLVAFSGGREGASYYVAGGTTSEGGWAPGYQSNLRHGIASLSTTGKYGTISGFYLRQRDAGTPDDQSPFLGSATVDTGFRTDTAQQTVYGGSADLALTPFWTVHASGGVHRAEYGGSGHQTFQESFDSLYQHAHQIARSTSYDARTTVRAPLTQGLTTLLTVGMNQTIGALDFTFDQRLDTMLTQTERDHLDVHFRGYYGVIGFRYNDLFVLNAGARREDKLGLSGFDDSKWRPRADAAFMMPTSFGRLTLRGGVGEVVAPAQAYINAAPSVGNPSGLLGAIGMQDLRGAEVGADFVDTLGAIGITLYDQRSESAAARMPSSLGTVTVFNIGGARNKGLSAYARMKYHEWSGRAAYSVVQSRQDSLPLGIVPPYAEVGEFPSAYGHGSLTYTGESIRLSYDVNYTGSHHNVDFRNSAMDSRTYPAFFLHDINASLPFGPGAWLILYAHNVANAEEYDINNGTYVRGRRLGFGVRFGRE